MSKLLLNFNPRVTGIRNWNNAQDASLFLPSFSSPTYPVKPHTVRRTEDMGHQTYTQCWQGLLIAFIYTFLQ